MLLAALPGANRTRSVVAGHRLIVVALEDTKARASFRTALRLLKHTGNIGEHFNETYPHPCSAKLTSLLHLCEPDTTFDVFSLYLCAS